MWKSELSRSWISVEELLAGLKLTKNDFPFEPDYAAKFKLKATPSYINKMSRENPQDPLLLQILPRKVENETRPDYCLDPVGDNKYNPTSALIKKYHGRALLITGPNCPLHCRFCFRRNFPYAANSHLNPALQFIARDREIKEIILSGGDPLSLGDNKIFKLLNTLEKIPHLKTVRLHTRFPAALPARLNPDLIKILAACKLNIVLVSHFNHPAELDEQTMDIMRNLPANIIRLNQAVLLHGINDSYAAQSALAKKLLASGILPYYLHLPDKARGTAHFAVARPAACGIIRKMENTLPGYLVPKLVKDVAGSPAKFKVL